MKLKKKKKKFFFFFFFFFFEKKSRVGPEIFGSVGEPETTIFFFWPYGERPESRKVHSLGSHTDGVSRGALSDLLYQKPSKSPAVSDQFVCLHLYF